MRRASERTAVRRAGQGTGAVACASRAIVGSMMRRTCVLTRWVGAGLLGSALGLLPFDDQYPIAGRQSHSDSGSSPSGAPSSDPARVAH